MGVAVGGEGGDAEAAAEGHPLPPAALDVQLLERALQLEALDLGLGCAAFGEDDHELVARVAHAAVVRADGGAQDAPHLAQGPIAGRCPNCRRSA